MFFYYFYLCAHVCLCHICVGTHKVQMKALDPPKLELYSYEQLDARKDALVLWKMQQMLLTARSCMSPAPKIFFLKGG